MSNSYVHVNGNFELCDRVVMMTDMLLACCVLYIYLQF